MYGPDYCPPQLQIQQLPRQLRQLNGARPRLLGPVSVACETQIESQTLSYTPICPVESAGTESNGSDGPIQDCQERMDTRQKR